MAEDLGEPAQHNALLSLRSYKQAQHLCMFAGRKRTSAVLDSNSSPTALQSSAV